MVPDPSASRFSRITDVHIHIQPWRDLKPQVQAVMRAGKEDHWDFLLSLMDDPRALLQVMDRAGVWRVGLVNYPSPDIMGFTDSTTTFPAHYAAATIQGLVARAADRVVGAFAARERVVPIAADEDV